MFRRPLSFIGIAAAAAAGGPSIVTSPPAGSGVWLDYTDATTLFADSARTTPATQGGALLGVTDKSGAGRHGVGTATTLGTGNGGKNAAIFDGATAFMAADSFAALLSGANKPFTIAIVAEPGTEALNNARVLVGIGRSTASQPEAILSAGSTFATASRFGLARRTDAGGTAQIIDAGAQTVGTLDIWIIQFTGTVFNVWKNGFCQTPDAAAAGSGLGTATLDLFTIGALRRTTTAGFFLGKIYEVIGYASALPYDSTGILTLQAYLDYKHAGIASTIPAAAIVVTGQSNAVGRAPAADYAANQPVLAAGSAFEIDDTNFNIVDATMTSPVGADARSTNTGGPIMKFAQTWYEQTGQVCFVTVPAKGNTSLQPGNTTDQPNGIWSTLETVTGQTGAKALATVAKLKAQGLHQRLLKSPRYTYPDAGVNVVWHQGESDGVPTYNRAANAFSVDGVWSKGGYVAELVSLRDTINAVAPVKRFLIAELGAHRTKAAGDEPNQIIIRQAQAQAASLIPNGYLATTVLKDMGLVNSNYANGTDTTHYSMTAYNYWANDMAFNAAAHRGLEVALPTGVLVALVDTDFIVASGGTAKFKVLRYNNLTGSCSVDYSVNGVATGTVSFAAGEQIKVISVAAPGADGTTYTVALSNPTGCTLGPITSGVATVGTQPVILGDVAFDVTTGTTSSFTSTLSGHLNGSTYTFAKVSGPGTISLSATGGTVTGTFSAPGTYVVTPTITNAGATNSPYVSANQTLTIS